MVDSCSVTEFKQSIFFNTLAKIHPLKKCLTLFCITYFGCNSLVAQSKTEFILKGDSLYIQGEYKLSVDYYTKSIELGDSVAEVFFKRGMAELDNKSWKPALRDFTTAINLDSTYAKAYEKRAALHQHMGNYHAAKLDLDKAIKFRVGYDDIIEIANSMHIKMNDTTYETEFIFEIPNATKEQLFERANEWVLNTYRSAKAVTQYSDKDAGSLVVTGNFQVEAKAALVTNYPDIHHTVTIRVKPGRVKVQIGDISLIGEHLELYPIGEYCNNAWVGKNYCLTLKKNTRMKIIAICKEINESMKKEVNDW